MQRCRAAMGWMGGLRLPRLSGRVDSLDLLIIAAAALGAALVLARALPHGVGLTHDSLYYIEVARNVLAGEGIVNHDGAIHTIWPPGYPILLAIAGLGIADPHTIAAPLNAVLFGLTIFAVGRYLRGRLETPALALWACLAIALALPLADLARFAMSETAFILFATLALMQTDRALRDDGGTGAGWCADNALLVPLLIDLMMDNPDGIGGRRGIRRYFMGRAGEVAFHGRAQGLAVGASGFVDG